MATNDYIKPSERFVLLGVIDPDANSTGALSTGYVDMSKFSSVYALVAAGTIASTGKIDFKLQQATTSGGAGVKDISGKSITQLTEAGTDSDKQAVINCHESELDAEGGFRFVKAVYTGTTAGADSAAFIWGVDPKYPPVDATTVDEVVG